MKHYFRTFTFLICILSFNQILSQEKNKSKIENYLLENHSFSAENYTVKGSVETNPNYDVYYIQQKLNGINIHNAINTLTVKGDKINSVKNRFVVSSFGK